VRLDTKASHHLAHVLRARLSDPLILFNGQGGEYHAEIQHIDKKGVEVRITSFVPQEVESSLNLWLAQGMARGEKMDFIVQKAVELGVKKIIPLVTERCTIKLNQEREQKRLQHWQSIMISACEQSGRNRLAEIEAPMLFEEGLYHLKADRCFVLSPHVQTPLPKELLAANASILLLIGPEGGLSEREIETAVQQGYQPLHLGPRILRTETAAIAALAALQTRFGDFI
jgi:16S rRNA (uracil1498-N3)-methyltransferase